jgi:hypothetical protein
LNPTKFLPRIYATTNAAIQNSTGEFLSILDSFSPASTVIVQSSEIQRNRVSLPENSLQQPNLTFQMISPSLYEVQVTASGAYMLVLSETYNPFWVASGPWGTVPDSNHFVVNGYANMWYITQPGSYKLRLSFLPNQYVIYGTVIALLALILGLVAVYARRVRHGGLKLSRVILSSARSMNAWKIRHRATSYHWDRNYGECATKGIRESGSSRT